MNWKVTLSGVAATAMLGSTLAFAQQPAAPAAGAAQPAAQPQTEQQRADQQKMERKGIKIRDDYTGSTTAVRASELQGMSVLGNDNETIGSINDLVVDPSTGKIKYAALQVGGFLGIGSKLFAVPWEAFGSTNYEGYQYLTLNVKREAFDEAPAGFDSNKWPDMADENLQRDLNAYYRETVEAQQKRRQAEQQAERVENQAERTAEQKEREAQRIREQADKRADQLENQAERAAEQKENQAERQFRAPETRE